MTFFRRLGKSFGTTIKDFGTELKEGFEAIPQKFEQVGLELKAGAEEAVEKVVEAERLFEVGLEKTLEFIDIIKGPLQEASKIGEAVGAIAITVGAVVPPPAGPLIIATGGAIEALSFGIDKGIDLLNKVETKTKQAQKIIATTKSIIEKGKELKEKHGDLNNPDIISIIKDTTQYAKDLRDLQKQINALKDFEQTEFQDEEVEELEEEGELEITITELNKKTIGALLEFAEDKEIIVPATILGKKIKKKEIVQIVFDGLRGEIFVEPTVEEQISKMTVSQLKSFAKKNKIVLPKKAKKSEITEIIIGSFETVEDIIEEVGEDIEVEQEPQLELERMTVKELKKLVRSLGVKSASLKKADLIEAVVQGREKQIAEQQIGDLF